MNHVNSNYHKSKLQKSQTTYTQMGNWGSGVAAYVSDVYHERNACTDMMESGLHGNENYYTIKTKFGDKKSQLFKT